MLPLRLALFEHHDPVASGACYSEEKLGSLTGVAWMFAEQDVEAGIGAVDYLRRQRSVQHLPDRGEVEAAKAQQGGVGSGGYVSTFISKAQVGVASMTPCTSLCKTLYTHHNRRPIHTRNIHMFPAGKVHLVY